MKSINLYLNHFFLHSFLDENIGNEKGNNVLSTIKYFKKYLPNQFNHNFKYAVILSKQIIKLISNTIKIGEKIPDGTKIVIVGSRSFLRRIDDIIDVKSSIYDDYASEYKNPDSRSSNYFIDIERESMLDNEISKFINIAINRSAASPVFFPIGYSKHLLGLVLTSKYIVITNSGDGIEHHNKSGEDTQCVLHFKRPCNNILKKILKEFIQIRKIYNNIDINSVYAIIYKLYFLHIIEVNNYVDDIANLIDNISSELTNGIVYHPSMVEQKQNKSKILKAVWDNPEYHEEVVYTLYVNYEGIKNILSEMFTKYILDKFFENNNKVKITDILSQIKKKIIGELCNTHRKEQLEKLFIHISYPVSENDTIIIAMKKYIKLPENNNSMSYNFEKVLMTKINTVLKQNKEFNIFSDYVLEEKNDKSKTYIKLELFCDLLLHESIASENSIVIKKNNKTFLEKSADLKTDNTKNVTPTHKLFAKLKSTFEKENNLPELFKKIYVRKIDAYFSDHFYIREQYAGSCTFNGILLAASLFGTHQIIMYPIEWGDKYQTDYNELKSKIRMSQINKITEELNNNKLILTDRDRLVVDALEIAIKNNIYAPNDVSSLGYHEKFIKLLREKLPAQNISYIESLLYEAIQVEKKPFKSYLNIINIEYDDLKKSWEAVQIMGHEYYNEQSFTKFVMNPTIKWILNNKDNVTNMYNLVNIITSAVIAIAEIKKISCNMSALFIIAIYVIFKYIQINKFFNENGVSIVSELYKKTHDDSGEKLFFDNFYLTTSIDEDAMIDLCTIISRYQFLILSTIRISDFVQITNIMNMKNISNNTANFTYNDDTLDKYTKLLNTDVMIKLANILQKCDIINYKKFNINNVITTTNNENLSDIIKAHAENQYEIAKSLHKSYYIDSLILKYDDNAPFICIHIFPDSNTPIFFAVIELIGKNILTIVYPHNGYIIFNIHNILKDPPTYGDLITVRITFSSSVKKNTTIYKLFNNLPKNLFGQKYIDDYKIFTYTKTQQENKNYVIDMLKVKDFLDNGIFSLLKECLIKFLNKPSNNYEFYLPLYYISPDKENLHKISITENNILEYDGVTNYQIHSSHKIMEFYNKEIKEIKKLVEGLNYPALIDNIIKGLLKLSGEGIDEHVEQKNNLDSINNDKNILKLSWGNNTCRFISEHINPSARLGNKFIFSFGNDSKNKIVYDKEKNNVYVNEYQIMKPDELEIKINELKIKGESKNAQMIKNMIYYAKGIPEFVIGLNSECTVGIIAFMPKNKTYYEKYFYDHPWVEINKCDYNNFLSSDMLYDDLRNMLLNDTDTSTFTWVSFDIEGFNSVIPVLGSDIISENDNYLLSFTLFCEHLLLQGKYELFGILIPQLVSTYFTVIESSSNNKKVILSKHKKLLDFIIEKDYVISPYKYYYLNKLTKLINGEYKHYNDYNKRIKYYPEHLQNLNNIELINANTINMKLYTNWTNMYNNKTRSKLLEDVKKLLECVDMIPNTDIDVSDIIGTYPDMITFICKNCKRLNDNLQYTILNKVKEILEDKNIKDEELKGKLKHYTKETFEHSLKNSKHVEESKYIILFELITGKIVTKDQYNSIMDMLDDEETKKYKVYELLMHKCKNGVIIPCLMFCCMMSKSKEKYVNIINCLPIHLVNQSINILNQLTPFLVDGFIVGVICDRNLEMNKLVSSLIDLKVKKILCVDNTSLKSYFLSNVKKHINTSEKLRDNTLILLDEFDTMTKPLRSDINFPNDASKNLQQHNILNKLVVCITDVIFEKHSGYMLYSDRVDKEKNKSIIKDAMNEITGSHNEPIEELRNEIIKYYESLSENSKEQLGSMGSLLAFIISDVYHSYVMCLEMMLDKEYGWDESAENDKFIVIPYSAKNTPIKGSKYSDPIIIIILTSIAYFSKSFRYIDSEKFIEYIKILKQKFLMRKKDIIETKHLDKLGIKYAVINDVSKLSNHLNNLKTYNKALYKNYLRMFLEDVILVDVTVKSDRYIKYKNES